MGEISVHGSRAVNANGKLAGWTFALRELWLGWKFKHSYADEDYDGDEAYKRFKGFEFLIHSWKAFRD